MQAMAAPVIEHHVVSSVDWGRRAPLFQLNYDERRVAGLGMLSAQHRVRSTAGEGQLVLEQNLDLVQPGVEQIVHLDPEAALPGTNLSEVGPATVGERKLLTHHGCQRIGVELLASTRRGPPKQRHDNSRKEQRSSRSGWRLVVSDAHCRAERITPTP
jgi:hypothetical protein